MAKDKVRKGFFFYFGFFLLIILAVVLIIFVVMMFMPGTSILGLEYFSNSASSAPILKTTDESQTEIDFEYGRNFQSVEINATYANVEIRKNKEFSKNGIYILNNSKGFVTSKQASPFEYNVTIEDGVLKISVKEQSAFLYFSKDIKIIFQISNENVNPLGDKIEMAKECNLKVNEEEYKQAFAAHQELARASAQSAKSGLASSGEVETKYHTATHLLNAALKKVVGESSHQMGSNINAERLRFDFACDHKLTEDELKQVENIVNEWIKEDIKVTREEMKKEDAVKAGAEHQFIERYPDIVSVYTIGDASKEICTGPHVEHTGLLGHFVIKKEEASSAGVRRIKAILQ